jgi:DNA-binding PadR family transcriptional regulator
LRLWHSPDCVVGRSAGLAAGLQPGTAYPILLRLEHEGWVASRWEDIDPRAEKRPARRYYRLTAGGAAEASAALAGARRPKGTALRRLAEGGGTA